MRAELGEALKRARVARGLSLEATGRAARISQGYLHKLEAGRVNNPSPPVLQRLSEVLELPYRRLMELADYLVPEEATAMPTDTQPPPTNRELVRLLERVLDELAELKRGQQLFGEALERVSRGGS